MSESNEERRGVTFPELVQIMERLRGPGGCPWDREQSHATLKPYLIEEAYEVLEAIDEHDDEALCEELGDLLLQVVFHAELARESKRFVIDDVVRAICGKLVRRHPHVFGDVDAQDSEAVLQNWYRLKEAERKKKKGSSASVLDGVPRHLPALLRAQRLGEKAASVGFDWADVDGVLDKVEEEIRELRAASSPEERRAELGDLLFSLAQLARRLDADAEESLQGSSTRFERRFRHIEGTLAAEGRHPRETDSDELEHLWEQAKSQGR